MRVEVTVDIPMTPQQVWADLERIETHAEWMEDAERIEFITGQRRGVGTEIIAITRVGPLRTSDRMQFVEWSPPFRMGVEHRGLFTGRGVFTLEPTEDSGTRFTWTEEVSFPWFLGGPLGALLAKPVLRRIWRRNLARLRTRLSSP